MAVAFALSYSSERVRVDRRDSSRRSRPGIAVRRERRVARRACAARLGAEAGAVRGGVALVGRVTPVRAGAGNKRRAEDCPPCQMLNSYRNVPIRLIEWPNRGPSTPRSVQCETSLRDCLESSRNPKAHRWLI